MTAAAFIAAALGLVLSLAFTPIVIKILRRAHFVDIPTERSSHTGHVPRGGGLAVVTATVLAVGASVLPATDTSGLLPVSLLSIVFAVLGFADDWRSLPPLLRLGMQFGAAGAFVAYAQPDVVPGPAALSFVVGIVWLVGFVNAFNFMDGINGISAVTTAIIGGTIVVAGLNWGSGGTVLLTAAIAGSSLGFLPSNFPRAKVFLGDTGSYAIGAALAATSLCVVDSGVPLIAILPAFAVYVGDVTWTLIRRAKRGESLIAAHREHVYQQLANGTWGHPRTTVAVSSLTSVLATTGLLLAPTSMGLQILGAVACGAVVAAYLGLPDRRTDQL